MSQNNIDNASNAASTGAAGENVDNEEVIDTPGGDGTETDPLEGKTPEEIREMALSAEKLRQRRNVLASKLKEADRKLAESANKPSNDAGKDDNAELEALRKLLAERDSETKKLRGETIRARVASEYNLPAEALKFLPQTDDEDELEEAAEALAAFLKPAAPRHNNTAASGARGTGITAPTQKTRAEVAQAKAEGRNKDILKWDAEGLLNDMKQGKA